MVGPEDVLTFWLEEAGERRWYDQDPAFDQDIRDRFLPVWEQARAGGLKDWSVCPRSKLAYLILTDQFPRNMFRGSGDAFATDKFAHASAKLGIFRGWDLRIPEPARQFYYLPLMHSENLADQERCVRLVLMRMPETGAITLHHARAHRKVIRDFGRFPYRNAALGRRTAQSEADYLGAGGYAHTLREMGVAA
ncbi:DUF924 family protein [Pontibaca methylaminivorans]|uniref:DUF924 family protein n=1 Tax=Pontibaca methylaminivorans TaxID=515897 RepID=UPI002FDA59DF